MKYAALFCIVFFKVTEFLTKKANPLLSSLDSMLSQLETVWNPTRVAFLFHLITYSFQPAFQLQNSFQNKTSPLSLLPAMTGVVGGVVGAGTGAVILGCGNK